MERSCSPYSIHWQWLADDRTRKLPQDTPDHPGRKWGPLSRDAVMLPEVGLGLGQTIFSRSCLKFSKAPCDTKYLFIFYSNQYTQIYEAAMDCEKANWTPDRLIGLSNTVPFPSSSTPSCCPLSPLESNNISSPGRGIQRDDQRGGASELFLTM